MGDSGGEAGGEAEEARARWGGLGDTSALSHSCTAAAEEDNVEELRVPESSVIKTSTLKQPHPPQPPQL